MAGPKFTVLFEKLRGTTFDLDREVMSIGRRDGMDICIKDSSMSGHHADIIAVERNGKKTFVLRDNDSTNGTKINGVQVQDRIHLPLVRNKIQESEGHDPKLMPQAP